MKSVIKIKIACLLVLIGSVSTVCAQNKVRIKIACLGASITYGARLEDPSVNSYPAQLQRRLGEGYQVTNYGVSGATLLKKGDKPYLKTNEYQQAVASNPDIVFIDLGGNDSKLINRIYLHEYEADHHELIESFRRLNADTRIILLSPITSFVTDSAGIWAPAIRKRVIPRLWNVAYNEKVELLDLYPFFIDKPALLPDKIHPNLEGTTVIANRLYDLVMQDRDTAFNIFNKMAVDGKVSSFFGYECMDFRFNGRDCKVVKPKWTNKSRSWIWRARFWAHEPQTDIALLERGFHLVYCDVAELFGNKEAIKTWNDFYSFLAKTGLSEKAVLEGMSRGAVYVYNWAAENPEKVACVYVDNPVLDLLSWPGSQYVKKTANQKEWETFKKDYGFTSDDQAMAFKGNPIDKVEKIVKGNYPMLHICGDADEDVPMKENTTPFEKKVRALGGNITVIVKPGFKHHPHSLPDPSPIVDFICKAIKL